MRKISSALMCLLVSGSLLTACGNSRQEQINKACTLVDFAWDTYSKGFKTEIQNLNRFDDSEKIELIASKWIPEASKYLDEAGLIFRDLAASDSGFKEYATAAFETSRLSAFWWGRDDGFENYISPLYYFCGAQ